MTAQLKVECKWNTRSLARRALEDANDAAITKDTVNAVIADLRPTGAGVPPRKKSWVPSFTASHEQFQCKDYVKMAKTTCPRRRST